MQKPALQVLAALNKNNIAKELGIEGELIGSLRPIVSTSLDLPAEGSGASVPVEKYLSSETMRAWCSRDWMFGQWESLPGEDPLPPTHSSKSGDFMFKKRMG